MIRFTFIYLKPVALFLAVLVLFQCCVVYDKKPVTVEEAIDKDHKKAKRIRIDMVDGEKLIADSIYYKENNLYYPKKVKSREKIENSEFYKSKSYIAEIRIDEDKIKDIWLQNRRKSRGATAMVIILPPTIFVAFGFAAMQIEY